MAAISAAHHTGFTVADLERSVAFFQNLLGLEVHYEREIREGYFDRVVGLPGCVVRACLLRIPGSTHHVELFEYVQPRGETVRPRPCDPGSAHLALVTNDLPALYARLRAGGVACVSPPVAIDAGPNRGGLALYLHDPNGILIELVQPAQAHG
jgi:catechol 2,3-dioxygenase-like lactoylglutathione lyase family enzyme